MGKTVEIPQVGETVTGAQRSVTLQLETVRQQAPAEIVEITEQGPPLPAERAPDVFVAPQAPATTVVAEPVYVAPQVPATYAAQPMTVAPAMTTMALPTTYGTTGDLFSTLDRNHDGVLTRSEFNRMY